MFLRNPNIGTSKTFKEIVDGKELAIDESTIVPELTYEPESNNVSESPEPLPLESVATFLG
jgi:hypothetical protein